MSPLSSGGKYSSRTFAVRELKMALGKMPSSQSRAIRKLARDLDTRTQMGYYAALDLVAIIGTHMFLTETPKTSTNST
jgi:hypothetical protein